MIRPLIAVQCRNTAKHNAADERHKDSHQTKLRRNAKRLENRLGNTAPRLQRYTKISVKKILHIICELHLYGFVQTITGVQCLHDCLRLRLLTVERSAGDRIHRKEGNDADEEHRNNRQQHTFYNILSQLSFLSSIKNIARYPMASVLRAPLLPAANRYNKTQWRRCSLRHCAHSSAEKTSVFM